MFWILFHICVHSGTLPLDHVIWYLLWGLKLNWPFLLQCIASTRVRIILHHQAEDRDKGGRAKLSLFVVLPASSPFTITIEVTCSEDCFNFHTFFFLLNLCWVQNWFPAIKFLHYLSSHLYYVVTLLISSLRSWP